MIFSLLFLKFGFQLKKYNTDLSTKAFEFEIEGDCSLIKKYIFLE